ncbi:hypothetical protein K450DRAFT_236637 [Umbelopsis ramanniana AG]|uniref:Uncharacterized protein n=1 Tax=Umbelopsis ramanniana AG TaxID=1314678 RepID=A0AAD5HDT8_UMBRA|nr:uncharacterized protein K450DRAFT_236637 [Umbelopsis ramanniana AG]KAI8580650.1 hypothetical protein K450DRAFT_236637 [Umbelopsis ramanniana AG]
MSPFFHYAQSLGRIRVCFLIFLLTQTYILQEIINRILHITTICIHTVVPVKPTPTFSYSVGYNQSRILCNIAIHSTIYSAISKPLHIKCLKVEVLISKSGVIKTIGSLSAMASERRARGKHKTR